MHPVIRHSIGVVDGVSTLSELIGLVRSGRLGNQLSSIEEGATDFRVGLARPARFDAFLEGHWHIPYHLSMSSVFTLLLLVSAFVLSISQIIDLRDYF